MSDNIDELVAKAISEFASARKLGEDMVRAILAYKGWDTACTSETFEGWKHYDDIEDFIEEYYDIEEEMDRARYGLDENPDDDDELRYIVYDHLSSVVFDEFAVIELCDYLEDGDGYLIRS